MFAFPEIDPVILHIWGPVALRWYNLAYILGFGLGFCALKWWQRKKDIISTTAIDAFLPWAILSVVIGGRVGEFLFFHKSDQDFIEILYIWHGGMSFHGALGGLLIGTYIFCKKYKINYLSWLDHLSLVAPIGVFFGRIANFINDELYGRLTFLPWAVRFPSGGFLPRHPSQLYEAFFEGVMLFTIINFSALEKNSLSNPGKTAGIFLAFYGFFRFCIEFTREPDGWWGPITIGQALCLPMIMYGLFLALRKKS